jgi:uncharacterized protein YjbJ (UPF0337 family)
MQFKAHKFISLFQKLVGSVLFSLDQASAFRKLVASTIVALAVGISYVSISQPALATSGYQIINPTAFATMSNKADAVAKDAEGKLQSAYGDLTGDTGSKVKGQAKQVQASAMNTAEDVKEGAKSAAKNVSNAAKKITK